MIPIVTLLTEDHEHRREFLVIVDVQVKLFTLTTADGDGGTQVAKPEERPVIVSSLSKVVRKGVLVDVVSDDLPGRRPESRVSESQVGSLRAESLTVYTLPIARERARRPSVGHDR